MSDKKNLWVASLNAVPACQRADADTDWFPAVDLLETRREYVFKVDVPGLKPEEVQLDVDGDGISISGNRLPSPTGVTQLRVERPSGAFVRHLPFPTDTTDEILGSFCDGVLELRISKVRDVTNSNRAQLVEHEP